MKYKIGDKVRVRKDLVPDNYYDKIDYASIMDEFETTDCIITGIMDGIYNINDSKYWFPAEMLELVDDEKILEYALEKLGTTKGELMDEMDRGKEDIEKAKEIVLNLIAMQKDMSVEQLASIAGVSVDQIKEWIEEK